MPVHPSPLKRPTGPVPKTNSPYLMALDDAMKCLSTAISAKLDEADYPFRFQAVQSVGKIGEAIGRMKARESKAVSSFIDPNGQQLGRGVDNYGMQGNACLGGIDPNDPFAPEGGPHPQPYGAVIGAPPPMLPGAQQRLGNNEGDDGNPLGALRGVFEAMSEAKQTEVDSGLLADRLNELTRLRELLKEEDIQADEREVLEQNKKRILGDLRRANDQAEAASKKPELPPQLEAGPITAIRCLDISCGNAHDGDWVDAEGIPRLCDICGSQMSFGLVHPEDKVESEDQARTHPPA